MVAPGDYRVRLTIGEKKPEEAFVLEMDPRLETAGLTVADLKEQEVLALRVRNLMSRANQLNAAVEDALKKEEANTALQTISDEMNTSDGRYQQPKLLAQISYLSNMIGYADQLPGQDAYERYDSLRRWFEETLEQWVAVSGDSPERFRLD